MIKLIKDEPHKFLLCCSIIFGTIVILLVAFGLYPEANSNHLFKTIMVYVRNVIGEFLIYAILYKLMFKFNKPTRASLNLLHILFLVGSSIYMFVRALLFWFDHDDYFFLLRRNLTLNEYVIIAIKLLIPILFVLNVLISFFRPSEGSDRN